MLGFAFVHVPYKGAGFTLNTLPNEKRFPRTPDIPTALEQGFKGLESYVWFGLYAPGKMPRTLIKKIHLEIGLILNLQETRDAMLAQGAEVVYTTPEEFDKFQRAEIVKWTQVIRDAKLQAQ